MIKGEIKGINVIQETGRGDKRNYVKMKSKGKANWDRSGKRNERDQIKENIKIEDKREKLNRDGQKRDEMKQGILSTQTCI